jgi:4-amino-4-deoxy-L-arabinose transferase-like glycosyltransferase
LRTGPDRRPSAQPLAKAPSLMHLACLMGLAALALLPGLGGSARLTYHEAFVAQGAREILSSGEWMYPTIGGLPWLEKPPLPWWLAAGLGRLCGGVNEAVARLPSALAAIALVLGVAMLAARHFGPTISLLSGAVQATTAWTVYRGRLAESDVLLACLITWSLVAFDGVLSAAAEPNEKPDRAAPRWRLARWMFFALLGATALVKGIGFGVAIVLPIVAAMLLWQRDRVTLRRLCFPAGWFLACSMALAWPLLMIARHGGGAIALWTMHVTDRLSGPGHFHSEPWWEYVPTILAQALPWTPLAAAGAFRSLGRACATPFRGLRQGQRALHCELPSVVVSGDRLLWAWTAVPLALLAIPDVKNAHYAIAAQVPWSIWAALAVARIGESLRRSGWKRPRLRAAACGGFATLALVFGIGLWLIVPRLDRRGVEWGFYESIGRALPSTMSLTFLYDYWDRLPYECPFGSSPHDLAVRLFYLGRPACWHQGADSLFAHDHTACCKASPSLEPVGPAGLESCEFAVVGRDRDLPELERLGRVEIIARGPSVREDRAYSLFRISSATGDGRLARRSNGERYQDQRAVPVTVPR